MYVKKRMSLLLFAALAMVLFTACGRWDFSREAAKAANEAQNAVVFEASATLAQSLKDALEDKVQTADVKAAMEADERLADLLGRLDVYAVEGDDAEAAAQTIADSYIKHISGRKSDGRIAMVKADNGWFYAAVVTTTTGGSGSDDGNGGDTTPDPDPEEPGTKNKYTVSWTNPENGIITVTTSDGNVTDGGKVAEGTEITITVVADDGYRVACIKADGTELSSGETTCTVNVTNNIKITAAIEEKAVTNIEVINYPKELTCYGTLDYSQIEIEVTYDDDSTRKISASDDGVTVEHKMKTYTLEPLISRIIRELATDTEYEEEVDAFLDKFATQVERNKLEVDVEYDELVGIIPVGATAYWDAKFTISYKEQETSIDVKLTCGANSDNIGTILCEYCPNWDGKDNIAPSARGSQSAHFDTEG